MMQYQSVLPSEVKALSLWFEWLLTHRLNNEERSSQQTGRSAETQLQILGGDMTQTEENKYTIQKVSIRKVNSRRYRNLWSKNWLLFLLYTKVPCNKSTVQSNLQQQSFQVKQDTLRPQSTILEHMPFSQYHTPNEHFEFFNTVSVVLYLNLLPTQEPMPCSSNYTAACSPAQPSPPTSADVEPPTNKTYVYSVCPLGLWKT